MHAKQYALVAVIAAGFGLAGGFFGASLRPTSTAPPAYFSASKADFERLSGRDFFSHNAEIRHLKATVVELSDGEGQAHPRLSGHAPGPSIAFVDSQGKERIELMFDERSISTFAFNDVFGKPKFSIFLRNYQTGPPAVTIYGHDERIVWEKP